jgi:hypothetical protein
MRRKENITESQADPSSRVDDNRMIEKSVSLNNSNEDSATKDKNIDFIVQEVNERMKVTDDSFGDSSARSRKFSKKFKNKKYSAKKSTTLLGDHGTAKNVDSNISKNSLPCNDIVCDQTNSSDPVNIMYANQNYDHEHSDDPQSTIENSTLQECNEGNDSNTSSFQRKNRNGYRRFSNSHYKGRKWNKKNYLSKHEGMIVHDYEIQQRDDATVDTTISDSEVKLIEERLVASPTSSIELGPMSDNLNSSAITSPPAQHFEEGSPQEVSNNGDDSKDAHFDITKKPTERKKWKKNRNGSKRPIAQHLRKKSHEGSIPTSDSSLPAEDREHSLVTFGISNIPEKSECDEASIASHSSSTPHIDSATQTDATNVESTKIIQSCDEPKDDFADLPDTNVITTNAAGKEILNRLSGSSSQGYGHESQSAPGSDDADDFAHINYPTPTSDLSSLNGSVPQNVLYPQWVIPQPEIPYGYMNPMQLGQPPMFFPMPTSPNMEPFAIPNYPYYMGPPPIYGISSQDPNYPIPGPPVRYQEVCIGGTSFFRPVYAYEIDPSVEFMNDEVDQIPTTSSPHVNNEKTKKSSYKQSKTRNKIDSKSSK